MAFSMNNNRKGALSEINVTPLVDVMLVLLIIFMVTAPMMQEGVTVDLPEVQKGESLAKDQKTEDVVIAIEKQGNLFVNDVAVTEDKLAGKIGELLQEHGKREVYLRADKSVPYGMVVRIMAILKEAGVANLGMITTPNEESGGK